jgi:uncharacterized protein (TIGR02646 family)
MIKVERSDPPEVFTRNEGKWPEDWDGLKDNDKAELKKFLVEMFYGKCAYCESIIENVSYGDIEHFRPKSKYRSLTFEWTNLLLACEVCNRSNKKTYFDENIPFVNPCEDDPNEHFNFDFDRATLSAFVDGRTERGKITVKILDLNRKKLMQYRSWIVGMAIAALRNLQNDPEDQELVRIVLSCHDQARPYLAFIRKYANPL